MRHGISALHFKRERFAVFSEQKIDFVLFFAAGYRLIKAQRVIVGGEHLRNQVFGHHAFVHGKFSEHEGFVDFTREVIFARRERKKQACVAHVAFCLARFD